MAIRGRTPPAFRDKMLQFVGNNANWNTTDPPALLSAFALLIGRGAPRFPYRPSRTVFRDSWPERAEHGRGILIQGEARA